MSRWVSLNHARAKASLLKAAGSFVGNRSKIAIDRVQFQRCVGIGHDRVSGSILDIDGFVPSATMHWLVLPGAGGAFAQFPVMIHQHVEKAVVPFRRDVHAPSMPLTVLRGRCRACWSCSSSPPLSSTPPEASGAGQIGSCHCHVRLADGAAGGSAPVSHRSWPCGAKVSRICAAVFSGSGLPFTPRVDIDQPHLHGQWVFHGVGIGDIAIAFSSPGASYSFSAPQRRPFRDARYLRGRSRSQRFSALPRHRRWYRPAGIRSALILLPYFLIATTEAAACRYWRCRPVVERCENAYCRCRCRHGHRPDDKNGGMPRHAGEHADIVAPNRRATSPGCRSSALQIGLASTSSDFSSSR